MEMPSFVLVILTVSIAQTLPYFFTGFIAFGLLRFIFCHTLRLDNVDAVGKEFE